MRKNWLIWNSANLISLTRLLAPFVLFATKWKIETELMFYIILAVTDLVDGIIARAVGNKDGIGKFIDGSVDKIFYGSGLIFLLTEELISYWIVVPILAGETLIIVPVIYGIWIMVKRETKSNPPSSFIILYHSVRSEIIKSMSISAFGKMKGVAYGLGTTFLLLNVLWPSKLLWVGYSSMFVSGFGFAAMALLEYYKKFQKWQDNFLRN
ncbi:MAG: hypothetical protein A3E91_00600 [Candidatus Moranbacteria bacterium RIFCSPHIGHO2_12_FULL_40_10]|nr:MAG: hypothetical protein A3E91_00600 [Candidatus Moranbacteria bacterium RIFCSPHIGHO2_12_FULL_40_10]